MAKLASGPVGIQDLSTGSSAISVFPNPASGILHVSGLQGDSRVSLCNLLGQEIVTADAASQSLQLDVSALPHGMYLLRAQTSKGAFAERVLIQ